MVNSKKMNNNFLISICIPSYNRPKELNRLLNSIDNKNNSLSISLGPRVMRSDTAVVAILAIFQMIIGDWKE